MSDVVSNEQKGLPSEDLSARSGMPADFSTVDLNALATMGYVPAKYQALMPFIAATRDKLEHQLANQTQDHEDSFLRRAFQAAAEVQRQIDRNMLKLNVDGQDINISQGDLRKIMTNRLEELEKQKKTLEASGANPAALDRINHLIEEYKPAIDETKSGKANAGTMDKIHTLLHDDPTFDQRVKQHGAETINSKTIASDIVDRRTSFSAEYFDAGGANGPTLKGTFANGASPDAKPAPAATTPVTPEKTAQKVDNAAQSLGF